MARRSARVAPEFRRDEILDAAGVCFAERGYHETKVDDIAERAGVSKGAVYWHFDGKRELFLALLDRYVETLREALTAAPPAGSPSETVARISEVSLQSAPQTMPMVELTLEYMAHASRDEELRVRFRRMYAMIGDALRAPLEAGIRDGHFRQVDVESAIAALVSTMDGLLARKVLDPELDLARVWRDAEAILVRGLAAP